jgi:predicted CXXCH cytochrome family protein
MIPARKSRKGRSLSPKDSLTMSDHVSVARASIYGRGYTLKDAILQTAFFVVLVLVLLPGSSNGVLGRISGGLHGKCEYCHIPGQNDDPGETRFTNQNRTGDGFSGKYSHRAEEMTGTSKLCLTCHDGTIARDHGDSYRGEGSAETFSVDLNRSHPVSVDYNTVSFRKSRNFYPAATIGPLKLYDGRVECGTCHDTHNRFRLRVSVRELCTRCHNM